MRDGTLLPPVRPLPAGAAELRSQVRGFLSAERTAGRFVPACDAWLSGWDESFSRRLAERGWVGMTIPREYGGHGRSALERYVVVEELLAAGAPVAAHWVSDRQVGPNLLRYGSEPLKRRYLPAIAQGACYFAIGLSEPDAGSDLAAVRTTGTRADGGWTVSGTKIWTSGAHRAHALIALLRTGPPDGRQRHVGLSQLLIELGQPGVTIRPIISMTGEHHFNEVVFDAVFVPDEQVVGTIGDGWAQVTSELAYERSGPERLLSTFVLLDTLVGELAARSRSDDLGSAGAVGRVVSRLWACRQMSLAVAGALAAGEAPEIAAALVKDVGTRLENEIIEVARMLTPALGVEPDPEGSGMAGLLAQAVLHAPGFTLRGGTNEILRGIVARGLALR
ncbi:MAG TPA: acyl-CoA dehydrogenase family protein [Streptosporangiaceae bacterium]|nr:acyl-CoA dehydrogenase family protein [Streptosporangiaceae bacterium]